MRSRVCIAAVLLAALAGCSGNDDPTADPSDPASSSAASEASGSDSATNTTDAPDVAPADGRLIRGDLFSYRLPRGDWDLLMGGRSAYRSDPKLGGDWIISSSEFEQQLAHTIDQVAPNDLRRVRQDHPDARRIDNRTVNGIEGWVFEAHGKNEYGQPSFFYAYGAVAPDGASLVSLSFEFPKDTPQTREAIESVLASVEWKS